MTSDFGSQANIEKVDDDVEEFKKKYPEAFVDLVALWKRNNPRVGHKRLGRTILGLEVLPYKAKNSSDS